MRTSTTTRTSQSNNNNARRGSRSRSSTSPNKTRKDGRLPRTKWRPRDSNPNSATSLATSFDPQLTSQQRISQFKKKQKKKKVIIKNINYNNNNGILSTKQYDRYSQLNHNSRISINNQSRSQASVRNPNRGSITGIPLH